MNRLARLFAEKKKDVLNIYFTAGYPTLDSTVPIIRSLAEAGADLIEIGMPYSDPMADGETIQHSSSVALSNGMNLNLLVQQIAEARRHTEVPLVLMGYFNQVLQYGMERFVGAVAGAGIDGLILPDLPAYEYERDFRRLAEEADLQVSFLITPQTTDNRIREIARSSTGFLYVVSSSSITGGSSEISDKQRAYFDRIEKLGLDNPKLIGFGISDAATFRTACEYFNGAIIGSAFIRSLAGQESRVAEASREFVERILQPQEQ
ncbi:tryptophan synthase alpha chain [Lewinella aquimaris]|uniref:Tryptophan synthase alpha chain n=1 Tax=Neolewinella aquimaris TaxID=1835722 RepID=A0A840E6D6_9BACT|nr:tryptophan synthase subunit alpha [Neolewinella aquimaris]MBB4077668.1 tryptophan synthase alpha chain [Neolewinella aquimaris]